MRLRVWTIAVMTATVACSRSDQVPPNSKVARTGAVAVGVEAPAYRSVSLSGDSVSLAGMRGKVVLLNVWATWCHPCRAEIPELRAIHATYKSRGLELIGVSVDHGGADEDVRQFLAEFQMAYPIWRDPDERVLSQFFVVGVPATFLIDRAGVLRWRHTGPIEPRDTSLTAAIDRALAS
jgi:cytochrome c-type biogenesis protein